MVIDDAARIRVIRAILGMDSKTFSSRVGISPGTCTAWEKGRASPQRDNRKVLAELCQSSGIAFLPSGMPVPMSDLLSIQEN
jgi:DNA-binding transcriptional regulator YiaG